jgi:uncharacterized protein involved in exopolysaccharide biosynthesis
MTETVAWHEPGPEIAPPPTWQRVLSDQRWFIIVFIVTALITSLALTYVFAEKYESSTAISYRVQEVTRFRAQQNEAMGSPAPQAPFKVIGTTLQEVLVSDAVLRDVVLALRLDQKPAQVRTGPWYKVWYETTKDWLREYGGYAWQLLKYGRLIDDEPVASAIAELRSNVKVTNRDSYIFNLAVRDRYPDRAARIVDHMSGVLANWLLEFDRQPGRYRADQLRVLLDQKGTELARRRKEVETLLTDNRVSSVQQDGDRLTEHLFSLQLEVSRLTSDIARSKTRLGTIDTKLLVKQRMLGASSSGAGTAPAAPGETFENIPPDDFKRLASERVFNDLEVKSLIAKRDALQGTADELSARLRKLPAVQNRYDTLKMELAALEREFTQINDGYQEAAVRATSPVSEVRVLHPALVPTNPVAPIKIYHVLLAVALGLPLAIGFVFLFDFLGFTRLLAPARSAAAAPQGST